MPSAPVASSSSSTLPLFWDLASPKVDKRLGSSSQLVSTLIKQQGALATSTNSSSDDDDPDPDPNPVHYPFSDEVTARVEAKLDGLLASEVSYSLRRLIRGLASPREQSRIGFAVALTELLAHLDCLRVSHLLVLIVKHSTITGRISRSEQRNLLLARLFGIQALVRSGILFRQGAAHTADITTTIGLLNALAEQKVWLRESCGWTLVQLLESLAVHCQDAAVRQDVASLLLKQATTGDLTPEKVALLLKLPAVLPSAAKEASAASGLSKGQDVLAAQNLATLSRVLRNADLPAEDKEDADGDADQPAKTAGGTATGAHNPRVHFVWDVILDSYFGAGAASSSSSSSQPPQPPASRSPFAEVYRICVDESLFAPAASPERKSWGFQVFSKALPVVPAPEKALLFTQNFMRTWINQLASKDRLLHKAAAQVAAVVTETVRDNPRAGFALVSQLLGRHGHQNFDKLTNTKTIEGLLAAMDNKGVHEYAHWLADFIATSPEDGKRRWALDQLLALVRNAQIPTSDDVTEDILQYLVAGGYLQIKGQKNSGLLAHHPTHPFSDDVRSAFRTRFLSCLTELSERTTLVPDEATGKNRRSQGVTSSGEAWVVRAWSVLTALASKGAAAKTLDEDAKAMLDAGRKLLERVRNDAAASAAAESSSPRHDQLRAFQVLVLASLLFSLDTPTEGNELLEPLTDAYERLFHADDVAPAAGDDADEDDEREPTGVELLLDYIVGLLERPSAFLRTISGQVFGVFVGEMNDDSLDHLIDQLGLNEEPGDEGAADGDGDADGDGGDDDSDEDTSETSDDSSDADEDADADADLELRNQVLEALKAGGMADDGDEDKADDPANDDTDDDDASLPDLTDDQMLQIDDRLADIFRQRLASRKDSKSAKAESVAFQHKILDLLATYAKRQSANPAIVRLVRPLFLLATEGDEIDKHLAQRAGSLLRSGLCKVAAKDLPPTQPASVVENDLAAVHGFACRATSPQGAALASDVNLYLTRLALDTSKELAQQTVVPALQKRYAETLDDFLLRSACSLKPQFLIDAFRRFPSLGWALRARLLAAAGAAGQGDATSQAQVKIKPFRQQQATLMLQAFLAPLAQSKDCAGQVLHFMPDVADVVLGGVERAAEQSEAAGQAKSGAVNAAKMKELLKFGLAALRIALRARALASPEDGDGDGDSDGDSPAGAGVPGWSPARLSSALTALSASERFGKSSSLVGLVRQMGALVESGGGGGGKGKAAKAQGKKRKGEGEWGKAETGKAEKEGKKEEGKARKKARKSQ